MTCDRELNRTQDRSTFEVLAAGANNLTIIAETSERFTDFRPYVPSINTAGVVAFQAATSEGGSGVYAGHGGAISVIWESNGESSEVCSHPVIADDGSACFFALRRDAGKGVFVTRGSRTMCVHDAAGPLGPTMNSAGDIAFHAIDQSGTGRIIAGRPESLNCIAETGTRFATFHGLPVINSRGEIAFRAALCDGRQCIVHADNGRLTNIVTTGDRFADLANFPSVNNEGVIAFVAHSGDGMSAVCTASGGHVWLKSETNEVFEHFRGALVDRAGRIAIIATPRGGQLGIFAGPDPSNDCVLSIGTPLLNSRVEEFSLNPVSVNDRGQLAIRIKLTNQRQLIVRADPIQS